jgi:Alpha-2,8-polysialyltransferase (POLYST)
MTTQVFLASTAFGLATAVAALEDGMFRSADRRVLVLSCNTEMPEASTPVPAVGGVPELCTRFDQVYDYNEAIEPLHPAGWQPRSNELPLWERYFRLLWSLGGDDIHLVVESIQVNPAQGLCQVFGDARIDVYADGLMSYGPTRSPLPDSLGCRIGRLLHLDLVPGLKPMLLSEWSVRPEIISTESMRSVIKSMRSQAQARTTATRRQRSAAMILGQYLAAGGLLTPHEEIELYGSMIDGCAHAGYSAVIFKPHPSAPPAQLTRLQRAAAARGVELEVPPAGELAEAAFEGGGLVAVVGCFSTGLMTASALYGLPVFRLGTELMLQRLRPYQNSNRIPVTIVDAVVPHLATLRPSASARGVESRRPIESPSELNGLVGAVGYAMQPTIYPDRRADAISFLAGRPHAQSRYVRRRRLASLELPGGTQPRGRGLTRLRRILASTIRSLFGRRR